MRLRRGLSRGKMASSIGVNTSTYTKMEKGIYGISLPRLYQIASVLNISCESLLDNDEPEIDYMEEQLIKAEQTLANYQNLIISSQGRLIQLHEKSK